MARFKWVLASALAAMTGATAFADTMYLQGTLRDFEEAHPDMEDTYNGEYPVIEGMVETDLGDDDKPVLNVRPGGCISITVTSHDKDLSNVVLELQHVDDENEVDHYKYDGLSGLEGTFPLPDGYGQYRIIGAWVKAGNNSSGDGPGYGEEIDGEHVEYEDETVDSESGDFTVTFTAQRPVPRQWRVDSEETFNQWHRNVAGVNQSIPYTIALENDGDSPGGVYTYERSQNNNQPFFPLDNDLFGNEDRSHNYHFTFEIATRFYYDDPAERDEPLTLMFSGDDDVWVFINRQLVIDLGGVHEEAWRKVNIDKEAERLGLEPGESYEFHFFFAERHTKNSNLTLETNMQFVDALYD